MPLTENKKQCTRCPGCTCAQPVAANQIIFAGALLMTDANGFAVPADDLTATPTTAFLGIADCSVDTTGLADGDKKIVCRFDEISVFPVPVGITQANVGQEIYAVDDADLGGAAAAPNLLSVGRIACFRDGGMQVKITLSGPAAP